MSSDTSAFITGGPFPEAAKEWISTFAEGFPEAETSKTGTFDSNQRHQADVRGNGSSGTNSDLNDVISHFTPQTLKQVVAGVLSMGRHAGLLNQAMERLARQEAQLRHLRERIGIERTAVPADLPTAIALVWTGKQWIAPGRWVPDLLDRAAAFDPLHQVDTSDIEVTEGVLSGIRGRVDHAFLMGTKSNYALPGEADGLAHYLADCQLHHITEPEHWLLPGPGVLHAIFDAASRMHGFTDLFFE